MYTLSLILVLGTICTASLLHTHAQCVKLRIDNVSCMFVCMYSLQLELRAPPALNDMHDTAVALNDSLSMNHQSRN
jgi:hypothetical protein